MIPILPRESPVWVEQWVWSCRALEVLEAEPGLLSQLGKDIFQQLQLPLPAPASTNCDSEFLTNTQSCKFTFNPNGDKSPSMQG